MTEMRAYALMNHGRWIVKCPWCNGAELAAPDFYCHSCKNAGNLGKPMPVVWPSSRLLIEAILLKRPDVINRNWLPGETIEMLRDENIEHGIEGVK